MSAPQRIGLTVADDDQQLPEIVPIVEFGKPILFDGPAKTGEGVQGHVLRVGGPA
jgi:hypothetical protein